jgi:hypothetical protein
MAEGPQFVHKLRAMDPFFTPEENLEVLQVALIVAVIAAEQQQQSHSCME